jgi:hypothetical protein
MGQVSQVLEALVASGTGEGEFYFGLIVIAVVFTVLYVRAREKRSKEAEQYRQFKQLVAESERAQSQQHLPQSAQFGSVIKPEVVALLERTPAKTGEHSEFDTNTVLQSAHAIHEALTSWMSMLRLGLTKAGTSEEEGTSQTTALYSRIEHLSKGYFPPIISLAIASTLRSYVQYLTTEEGGLNSITPELSVQIISSLYTLEDGLFALVRDAGWNKVHITTQCSELSEKITTVASTAKPGIAPLTLAFTIDNYAKVLLANMPSNQ